MCKNTIDPNAKADITTLTMYTQLKEDTPELSYEVAKNIIYSYFRVLQQRYNWPDDDHSVDLIILGGATDVKFEDKHIIFFNKKDGLLIERIYESR